MYLHIGRLGKQLDGVATFPFESSKFCEEDVKDTAVLGGAADGRRML